MKGIENRASSERITVPGHLLSPRGGEHFVLRVVGDNMVDEWICDGDYVIVLRREVAEQGELAVVLVGDDVTIKRVYSEGPMVRLQPVNLAMQAIRVPAGDVKVQGIVVGLMRKF